jgi:hypothetical protein
MRLRTPAMTNLRRFLGFLADTNEMRGCT